MIEITTSSSIKVNAWRLFTAVSYPKDHVIPHVRENALTLSFMIESPLFAMLSHHFLLEEDELKQ